VLWIDWMGSLHAPLQICIYMYICMYISSLHLYDENCNANCIKAEMLPCAEPVAIQPEPAATQPTADMWAEVLEALSDDDG
jgi:hypothetical protein